MGKHISATITPTEKGKKRLSISYSSIMLYGSNPRYSLSWLNNRINSFCFFLNIVSLPASSIGVIICAATRYSSKLDKDSRTTNADHACNKGKIRRPVWSFLDLRGTSHLINGIGRVLLQVAAQK